MSQSLCEVVTQRQATATVIRPIPLNPILDAPVNGDTSVDQKVTLKWHDPNVGLDNSADRFELEVTARRLYSCGIDSRYRIQASRFQRL